MSALPLVLARLSKLCITYLPSTRWGFMWKFIWFPYFLYSSRGFKHSNWWRHIVTVTN